MKNLSVGVFPYLSTVKLLKLHTPVINRLNSTLDENFTMVSAPSFGEFINRTKAGEYYLVITAPHMDRLAEMQSAYQRVVMTGNKSYAALGYPTWKRYPAKDKKSLRVMARSEKSPDF